MIAPFATWKPVSSHGGPMAEYLGVVIHVTAGEGDPYNEFANPANQVSSHFGIGNGQGGDPDGLIEQFVDTQFDSWAQEAGNGSYISVETEGVPTEPLTSAQIASFGKIMAWANQTYGIPLVITDTVGQRGLICHSDGGAAWGGHPCPGPIRASQRLSILAAAIGAPGVPPSSPTSPEDSMNCLDPTSNGTWIVDPDGHVETLYGAPYLGGLNELHGQGDPDRDNWREVGTISGITPYLDPSGWGYSIIVKHSSPMPGGGWYSGYTFLRSGANV